MLATEDRQVCATSTFHDDLPDATLRTIFTADPSDPIFNSDRTIFTVALDNSIFNPSRTIFTADLGDPIFARNLEPSS